MTENFTKVTFSEHGLRWRGELRQGLEVEKLVTTVIARVLFLSFEPHAFFVRCSVFPFSNLLPRGSVLGKKSIWSQLFRNQPYTSFKVK